MKALVLSIIIASCTALAFADTGSAVATGSGSTVGSAAPPAINVPIPDPNTDPLGTAGAAVSLWRLGAHVPAVIVIVYELLVLLGGAITWLKEGKRAAYVAAAIGLLAACLPAASEGQLPTLSALLIAAAAAWALIRHPMPAEVKS
jgi:hypothetical protein